MDKIPGADESTLKDLELSGAKDTVFDEEIARQMGYKCMDCGSKKVVYFISSPHSPAFPRGAYCYPCLLKRCLAARMIPFPIPLAVLECLKHDIKKAREHIIKKYSTGG